MKTIIQKLKESIGLTRLICLTSTGGIISNHIFNLSDGKITMGIHSVDEVNKTVTFIQSPPQKVIQAKENNQDVQTVLDDPQNHITLPINLIYDVLSL